jgi:hypothetical protein
MVLMGLASQTSAVVLRRSMKKSGANPADAYAGLKVPTRLRKGT